MLLAEVTNQNGKNFEIIDGMQRMNAIMSFIDQEFDINGQYFDLDTMADTKLLKDNGDLKQRTSLMDRAVCANIVRYQMPLSVFQEAGTNHVDEVFRRLNSGGRHLSSQELRQAGAVSKFASIVRKLSSNIRGDSSALDILNLNSMKTISITGKNLKYGIAIEDIFWIKNNIITKEALRQSKDEEIIADIVAWISIDKGIRSSSDILNQLYGYQNLEEVESGTSLALQVELEIQKINEETVISNIQYVFDKLIEIIKESGKTFNGLLFENQQQKISRYFQVVFLSLYQLLIEDGKEVSDIKLVISNLDKAGDKVISLAAGGGNWSAKEKSTQINALCGVLKKGFKKSSANDPSRNQWITRFENLLMQSGTEQTLYDFKVGLHALSTTNNAFDQNTFSKIIKTLTAMANTLPGANGYCILGVADSEQTAGQHSKTYKSKYISFSSFFITGINGEAEYHHKDIDKYFTKLTQLIKSEPISDRDKDNISRNIASIKYFDKSVILLKIEAGDIPSIYDNKYYVRHGSNVEEVVPQNLATLFQRFPPKKSLS